MADPAQIIVFRRRGKWSLKAAETDQVFADQLTAIKAGIELANERGKNGKPSVVLFRKSKDEFRKIWTYGIDSYPPSLAELSEDGAS
jgi:ABC-type Fe3+-hydroxamate transport system substrate-binding protein